MTELNLVVWGEGEPVILVHGSMSSGTETFAGQKPLSEKYRLILVDRRGYGGSPFTACSDFMEDARYQRDHSIIYTRKLYWYYYKPKVFRSYLKNGKLWLKSRMETSQWTLQTNNGTLSSR